MKTFALTILLTLALAVPALGQGGPSQDGYTAPGPQALEQTDSSGDPSTADDPSNANASNSSGDPQSTVGSGTLPFTGMDLVLMAVFGAGLLGVGAGMRRLTRPADPTSLTR